MFQSVLRRFAETSLAHALILIGLLVILLLAALHPLMFGAMPETADGLLHFYRLVALDHSVQHGDLWPRYSPGLLFGYGAPVFNYYAPLSLYPMEALHLLGFSFLNAYLLGLSLYAMLGALGVYVLGRAWAGYLEQGWWREIMALAASMAYAYAPYTLYNSPRRGALAEFVAFAVLPWVLWAFWRLAEYGRRRDFGLAVGLYALFIPIHNITTIHASILLIAYCLLLWWHNNHPPRTFVRLLLAGLFAVILTTFFWLPAIAEARFAHLDAAIGPDSAKFSNNFQSLAASLSWPLTADLSQLEPPVPKSIGWPQIVLGVVGLYYVSRPESRANRRIRIWAIFVAVALVFYVFLTTRASTLIWELIPIFTFTQLPWRLLGFASLMLALLAGLGVVALARLSPTPLLRFTSIIASLIVVVVYALPWLYVHYLPPPRAESIVDVQNFERATGWLATGSLREYISLWTQELPDQDRLTGLYAQSDIIPRLQPVTNVTVEHADWYLLGAEITFTADQPATMVFDWLYFPGFWARIDGDTIPIEPISGPGFLSIDVPEGVHHLQIGFGPTPLRLAAMIISGAGVALLLGLLFIRPLWPLAGEAAARPEPFHLHVDWRLLVIFASLGLFLFLFKFALIDNIHSPIKRDRFRNGIAAGLQTPIQASYADQITLLGMDLRRTQLASGEDVALKLYWQPGDLPVTEDVSSVLFLRDVSGVVIAQTGSQHPGDLPTTRWLPNFYLQERLRLMIPPATPPGTYTLDLALYSHEQGQNLPTFDINGSPLGVTVRLAELDVIRPVWSPPRRMLPIEQELDAEVPPALTLLGTNTLPETAEVGQSFPLAWYWRAGSAPERDFQARLVYLQDGVQQTVSKPLPLAGSYPTSQWRRGDIWKGLFLMHVPGVLQEGTYQVAVQLLDEAGAPNEDQVEIGQIAVTTPPRNFDAPIVDVQSGTRWSNGIELVGYDFSSDDLSLGDTFDLTLYWATDRGIDRSLTIFLHWVDSSGQIITQQDRIPSAGARPTTGWMPGEFLSDTYTIYMDPTFATGEYRLRVGWYDARTGQRVPLSDVADFYLLPQDFDLR